MPIYTLEFQTHIHASPQALYEHLQNPQNFIGLQPLLTQVERVRYQEKDGVQTVAYDTVEAFRWHGLVLYKNRIHAQTVFTQPPYQFHTVVHSFPNIVLHVEYRFTPQNGQTLVQEITQITTHAWLAKFVTTQAAKAQTALLANLKKRMES